MGSLGPTPSQTVGPFFGFALLGPVGNELVARDAPGAVRIAGLVIDGDGNPVPDAMVEIWQADAEGRYAHASENGFAGFGRCGTDEGGFSFVTVKPGPVAGANGELQAPHVVFAVFARGLLRHLVTRMYFPDEAEANASDPLLAALEDDERATLVANREGEALRFDIRLQGEGQTVFLAV